MFNEIEEKDELMSKKFFGSKYDHNLSSKVIYIMIEIIDILFAQIKFWISQIKIFKYDGTSTYHRF